MVGELALFFALFNNIAIFIALISLYSYLYNLSSPLNGIIRQFLSGSSRRKRCSCRGVRGNTGGIGRNSSLLLERQLFFNY